MPEFRRVKIRRPAHSSLKRQWPKWIGEILVDRESGKVYIIDVMQPSHLLAQLPPIGWPVAFEDGPYVYVDIDWGIRNAADRAEGERFEWLKTYALNRAAGDLSEPPLPAERG